MDRASPPGAAGRRAWRMPAGRQRVSTARWRTPSRDVAAMRGAGRRKERTRVCSAAEQNCSAFSATPTAPGSATRRLRRCSLRRCSADFPGQAALVTKVPTTRGTRSEPGEAGKPQQREHHQVAHELAHRVLREAAARPTPPVLVHPARSVDAGLRRGGLAQGGVPGLVRVRKGLRPYRRPGATHRLFWNSRSSRRSEVPDRGSEPNDASAGRRPGEATPGGATGRMLTRRSPPRTSPRARAAGTGGTAPSDPSGALCCGRQTVFLSTSVSRGGWKQGARGARGG